MLGSLLFSLQMCAIVASILPISLLVPSPLTLLFMMLAAALFLWVLLYNKLGNWSVLPSPKVGSHLITSGPYHFMRHPMYLAVMILCLGFVFHNQTFQSFFSWIALIAILNIKARYEERLLCAKFDDYLRYKALVKTRFIPSLF